MISGASSKELDIANARADIILVLDNTATYESWLCIDTYIEKLENEKQHLISFLEDKIKECNKDIEKFSSNYYIYFNIIQQTKTMLETYQEVLVFVNKGGEE